MNRRICAIALSLVLLLGSFALPVSAGAFSNFQKTASYSGQFTDVPAGAWYASAVQTAFELGLVGGKSATRFDPAGNLTLAEAAKLAACLNSIYETGTAQFPGSTPWYGSYVAYLQERGLITFPVNDWTAPATRAQFAQLLAMCLPQSALPAINQLEEKSIPDVATAAPYYEAAYGLYRAGILTGSDSRGSFRPNTNIQRSEVAAILTRITDPTQRKTFQLDTALSAQALFALCSPAVAYVEVFDANGKILGTGSGFFISQDGRFVTNYHVIEGASSATVKTTDGKTHQVTGAYGTDEAMDLALLQISGSGFSYLTQGDSKNLATGQNIFAIGSPLGLENSLSTGIVSSPSRNIGGRTYIQITAAISPGSSGGALLDEQGRVVGITTGTLADGQSLNMAVPIHLLTQLKTSAMAQPLRTKQTTPASPAQTTVQFYAGFAPGVDFGIFSGAPVYQRNVDSNTAMFFYRVIDIQISADDAVAGYIDLLLQQGFREGEHFVDDYGDDVLVFKEPVSGRVLMYSITELGATPCICIFLA